MDKAGRRRAAIQENVMIRITLAVLLGMLLTTLAMRAMIAEARERLVPLPARRGD